MLFEKEYSKYQGVKYCLSCTSGGYALFLALCSLQIKNNEPILTNSFTLSPVPGAIINAGESGLFLLNLLSVSFSPLKMTELSVSQSGQMRLGMRVFIKNFQTLKQIFLGL